jgi:phosphatidylglycerol:prolipoprotein diacylglycerol transferase
VDVVVSGEFIVGTYQTYATCVAASVLVGGIVLLATAHDAGISRRRAVALIASFAAAALLGAKLYGLIEQDAFRFLSWSNLFDGFRYPGALIGLLLALPLLRRTLVPSVPLGALGDWLAPATAFAEVMGRIGCFLAGCCFGVVSNLPWAVHFPAGSPAALFHIGQGWTAETAPASLPVHPLQLYFALLGLALGTFCLWLRPRTRSHGDVLLAFIVLHEVGKFLLELLRAPLDPEAGFYLRCASLTLASGAFAVLSARALRHRAASAAA